MNIRRRVVVKLGTSTLTRAGGTLAHGRFAALTESIAALVHAGHEVVIVSSGAVALGGARLRHAAGDTTPRRQARAAVGQARLAVLYADAFDRQGITSAQVLVTERDIADPDRAASLADTLAGLLELGALPVVNGNDAADLGEHATLENDRLAAFVATAVGAELLVLLTDVDGVFDGDPRVHEAPRLVRTLRAAGRTPATGGAHRGSGGRSTMLAAARLAARAGCRVVIANGGAPQVLERLLSGETLGTSVAASRTGRVAGSLALQPDSQ